MVKITGPNSSYVLSAKRICSFEYAMRTPIQNIGVQVHCCGGPVSASAALQLEAVVPNFVIHELHASALIDDNIRLCKNDYVAKDGYFEVPDAPGIGQELTDYALQNADIVTISE